MKLLYLFLILLSLLRAEEMGVPYVNQDLFKNNQAYFQAKSLAEKENVLYTLSRPSNLITKWKLNPLQKIESFDIPGDHIVHIWVTENGDRLVYRRKDNRLHVWDIKTKHDVGEMNQPDDSCTPYMLYQSIMIDNELIAVIDRLTLWKFIPSNPSRSLLNDDLPSYKNLFDFKLSRDKKDLFLISDESIVVIDTTNAAIKNIIRLPIGLKKIMKFYSDVNYDELYFSAENDTDYKMNINTQNIMNLPNGYIKLHQSLMVELTSYHLYKPNEILGSTHYSMVTSKNKIDFYRRTTGEKLLTIFYPNNESWIGIAPNGYYDGSPESRKYLYMKTPSGESVPIDDATYNKYHKPIYLNDLTKDK